MLNKKFVESYRNKIPPWGPIGYITYKRTYSRLIPELGRTEEWYETIARVCNSFTNYLTTKELEYLYDTLFNFKGMVSGRALWQLGTKTVKKLGGDSLQSCWAIKVNNIESFCFTFNQLMLGGGVGFNVQQKYVYELPIVKYDIKVERVETPDCDFIVPDNREGWVELLRKILQSFYNTGKNFYYSTQLIRAAGKPISSFGGLASGSESLVNGLNKIIQILKSRYSTKLRPIDCVDIMNIIGEIVIAGNVRRSSEIAIGDINDIHFLKAKNWDTTIIPNWRTMSNNSVICNNYNDLDSIFWTSYQGGEPCGLINLQNCRNFGRLIDGLDYRPDPKIIGVNPCGEQPLCHKEPCNLAEIYLPNIKDIDEFKKVAIALYKVCKIITSFSFSDPETKSIVNENQRLGIGLTGYMQCASWVREAETLNDVYQILEAIDAEYSKKYNCNQSIKLTTMKPSGTLSLLAGVTPGIHAAFSKYLIRRIRFSSNDSLIDICRKFNYKIEPQINLDGTYDPKIMVVSFPIETSAITEDQLSIIQKLEIQKFVQTYWSDSSISVTHYYRPEELDQIKKWLKENYNDNVKTISFFPISNHGFVQAPLEKITEDTYNEMMSKIKPIIKIEDNETINHYSNLECEGGCPVK